MSVTISVDQLDGIKKTELVSRCTFNQIVAPDNKYSNKYPAKAPLVIYNYKNATIKDCSFTDLDLSGEHPPKIIEVPFLLGKKFVEENNINPVQYVRSHHVWQDFNITTNLYDYQLVTLEMSINQLANTRGATVSLFPGAGKTIIGAAIIAYMKMLPIIVVPSTTLMEQWAQTFNEYTTAKFAVVGVENKKISGTCKLEEASVIICMIERIPKIPIHILSSIQLLMVDECHMFCTEKRASLLLNIHPECVVLESATPFKKNGLHKITQAIAGEEVISLEYNRPYTLTVIDTGLKPTIEYDFNNRLNYDVYKKSLLYHQIRNGYIVNIICQNPGKKILFMTEETDHADAIFDKLQSLLGEGTVSRCYGQHKRYSDALVLIGTTKKLGVGFDEARFCEDYGGRRIDMLILALTYKDPNYITQLLGRALRATDASIIIFRNTSSISRNQCRIIIKEVERPKNGEASKAQVVYHNVNLNDPGWGKFVDNFICIEDPDTLFLIDKEIKTDISEGQEIQTMTPLLLTEEEYKEMHP